MSEFYEGDLLPPDYALLCIHDGDELSDSQKLDLILEKMVAFEQVVNAIMPKINEGLEQVGPLVKAIEEMPLLRSILRLKK